MTSFQDAHAPIRTVAGKSSTFIIAKLPKRVISSKLCAISMFCYGDIFTKEVARREKKREIKE